MSLCSYSDTVEKARQGIELYLLNGNPELKDQGLSVALYERDGSLFERKLNLVAYSQRGLIQSAFRCVIKLRFI